MTAGAGRLALVEAVPRSTPEVTSLPLEADTMVGVGRFGVSTRRPATILISDISSSSSSSSSPNCAPLDLVELSPWGGFVDQRPSGSIVTASKLLGVLSRMSLTYLQTINSYVIG